MLWWASCSCRCEGYFAACIANPVAWFFACFFLIPAYIVVFRKLKREKGKTARKLVKLSRSFAKPQKGGSFVALVGGQASPSIEARPRRYARAEGLYRAGPAQFLYKSHQNDYTINNYVTRG